MSSQFQDQTYMFKIQHFKVCTNVLIIKIDEVLDKNNYNNNTRAVIISEGNL
jgi:hypothetical protein